MTVRSTCSSGRPIWARARTRFWRSRRPKCWGCRWTTSSSILPTPISRPSTKAPTPRARPISQGRASDGSSVTMAEVALDALHHTDQEQIMAVGSYVSPVSPPPFAAQFAEVTVDIETGAVRVDRLVMAVDSGVIVNPLTASGQIEGGMTQALGYAVCEE